MDHSNRMSSRQSNNFARCLASSSPFVSGYIAEESTNCKERVYTTRNTVDGQYPDCIHKTKDIPEGYNSKSRRHLGDVAGYGRKQHMVGRSQGGLSSINTHFSY